MFGGGGTELRDRVKRLRLLRRWDQSELAREAGTSATMISQIEQGRVTPSSEQVAGIASALGYSEQFLRAEMNMLPTTRPWLRVYADASKREADARTALATVAAEWVRMLGLPPLPDLIPPFPCDVEDDEAIDDAAAELRHLAQIEPGAVVTNAMRAAERVGCVVLPLESELGRHLGMSVRADRMPMMCIAKCDVPGDRQRWTVAHELGHLVLHGQCAPPRDSNEASRMEKQAHRFAAAFLAPADALVETLDEVGGKVTLRALAGVKAVWGVSIKSLVGRYRDLGVIDTEHARSLYKQISARKWSKAEPVDVPIEAAQWFEQMLLRKAGTKDLATATNQLASTVGGNEADLLAFADWAPRHEAQILSFAGRQRRPR
jgi:Zn-dependent peptidase ImmA (M78 family)/transcriptional regulator with XRE-family HTH domain